MPRSIVEHLKLAALTFAAMIGTLCAAAEGAHAAREPTGASCLTNSR